jgi:hypothetical protein
MLAACQIPDHVLNSISTSGLVDTVLNYPLFSVVLAYDSVQQGFDKVFSKFNGLQELFKRKDAGTELLARYHVADPLAVREDWTLQEKGDHYFAIMDLELMLSQDTIIASLPEAGCQDLVSEARLKYQAKLERPDIYSGDDLATSIIEKASNRWYSARDYYDTVTTPNGSYVDVIRGITNWTAYEISVINANYATNWPNATREADASKKYNCHSYAWHDQSTSNDKWMNYYDQYSNENVSQYWSDSSYDLYSGSVYPGLKMRYIDDDHSAIYASYSVPGNCRSKWGQGPRMLHATNYSPYDSTWIYFYAP